MRRCPYCGAEMKEDNANVCTVCRMPIQSVVTQQKKEVNSYYADVQPEDAGKVEEKKKSNLGIKIGFLIFGVSLVVAACVIIMVML